ncbi:MAG: hypothetical protein ACI8TX_002681 [Hyphomicrobiaceae bacterium]|jgi:hypothetical protein
MPFSRPPKISLGFVIRRCTLALGHSPTPLEFSKWANSAGEQVGAVFGRKINESEAEVMLRNKARPVSARDAQVFTPETDGDTASLPKGSDDVRDQVVSLDAIRARRTKACK